jgi:hypothetical protein
LLRHLKPSIEPHQVVILVCPQVRFIFHDYSNGTPVKPMYLRGYPPNAAGAVQQGKVHTRDGRPVEMTMVRRNKGLDSGVMAHGGQLPHFGLPNKQDAKALGPPN